MEAAVVSASQGAMASLLGNLGDLLTDKYKLLKGAEGQVISLKAELESMHSLLKKMSDAEDLDEQAKCWVKEIRELSYDIDDSVNEFLHCFNCDSSSKPVGFITRIMNFLKTMRTRRENAKEFEELMSRVMEVSERRKRYKVDDAVFKPNNTIILDRRLLALYVETAGLVGIDTPRDKLVQFLMDEDVPITHGLKVLSIVGFGGLGKTTLANQIYRKLKCQFECQAFVSVSQKPNIKSILRTALSQVGFAAPTDSNMEIWEDSELLSALREFLSGRRYFIVVDDIWEASTWDIFRCALPESRNGSRVVTTTRIESVARACCTDYYGYVYKMQPLNEQNSRRLFFKRVFGSEEACPPYLGEVSIDILKKCGGLPLAIITMSSLLASQPNKLLEQWEYVRSSMGSNFEVNPSLEGMRHILNLSYINLPHYLKSCMLYLSIYPEDYIIHKNDLARQWIAEGFISKFPGNRIDPEDVAKGYFNELINRSMIQPIDTDYNGEVMSCKVHDMMLDLILQKSREENFTTVIHDIEDMAKQHEKIRRLSLHLDSRIDKGVLRSVQLSQIRTLARFGTSSYLPPFLLFKHIRVLAIELGFCWASEYLDFTGICHLFQLRYLKIVLDTVPVVLPNKIAGLLQLQTFHIENEVTSYKGISVRELPSDIVNMSHLSHMVVPDWRKLPDGIGNMKSLRTLSCIDLGTITSNNIKGLGELTNLIHLETGRYYDDENSISDDKVAEKAREVLCTCLEKLCNLKYLDITDCPFCACLDALSLVPASFGHLRRFHAYFSWFSRVPGWVGKLLNLYDLKLHVKVVLQDDVEMLAQLPSLTLLNLRIRGAIKDKIIIRGNGFPSLQHFELVCSRISCLSFKSEAMTKLERLNLVFSAQGWDRYGAAPSGIEHLSGLKEISVGIECAGAKESNRRSAELALRNAVGMHPGHPTANIVCQVDEWFVFDELEDECDEQEHNASGNT